MEFTTIKTLSGVMKTGIKEIFTKKSLFLSGKFYTFIYIFLMTPFLLDGIIKCNSDTELNSVPFVVPEI